MDCNKTINFMKECKRMCDAQEKCERCPLDDCCSGNALWDESPRRAIEIVQKWSDEHSSKTYAQDFFEKFPNAKKDANMYPRICRQQIYGGECPDEVGCFNCWNEPMEE